MIRHVGDKRIEEKIVGGYDGVYFLELGTPPHSGF